MHESNIIKCLSDSAIGNTIQRLFQIAILGGARMSCGEMIIPDHISHAQPGTAL
jgi:hypothetical protein